MADNKDARDQKTATTNDLEANASDPSLSSNASNYKNSLSYQVDPRTGNLQVAITPPMLPGFFGTNITPAIHYTQQSILLKKSMLGLPVGWAYRYSFIYGSRIFINGQSSYYVDNNYSSGMRYYNLKGVVFKEYGDPLPFPYDKSRNYTSTLSSYNGETQYFDRYGRLIGIDDRFSNHVIFYYDKDGNVYESNLSKIIDSYQQETTFTYSAEGIKITYPTSGKNNIEFTYLVDKNSYLRGWQDSLGREIQITNKGGFVRNNLISKIANPNGLTIYYDYTTIRYYATPNKGQFSHLDCVASVKEVYEDITRTITYDYDPTGRRFNYTGYPTYSVESNGDALLESHNNEYRYLTHVNDGIFITEHCYNNLHLELETRVYTINNLQKPDKLVNHIVYTFKGEQKDQYFPRYRDLPVNYQTPIQVLTTVYNDAGDKRSHKTESDFDDYGNLIEVRSYETDMVTNEFLLASIEKTTYFDDEKCYRQILQKDLYDYSKANTVDTHPVIRRSINTLTRDNKNIETSTNGFVILENGEYQFKPYKKSIFGYNHEGKITFEKLEWADGKAHEPTNTESTTHYDYQHLTLIITHRDVKKQATKTWVDTPTGWAISSEDAAGHSISYTYDNLGRRLAVKDPLGLITKWVYDDKLNKITTEYANGYKIYEYYNGFGNPIKTADNMGLDGSERILNTQVYNDKGQLIQEEGILGVNSRVRYEYNNKGLLSAIIDVLGNVKNYIYDPALQLKTEYFNGYKISESRHNSNQATNEVYSSTSANQKITSTTYYDAYGKAKNGILGSKSADLWLEGKYLYNVDFNVFEGRVHGSDGIMAEHFIERDLFGNPNLETVNVTWPKPNKHGQAKGDAYIYNNLNQLIEERNSLQQSYYYTYNNVGLQETYQDYASTLFTSTYTWNNMVESLSYRDKSGKLHERKFLYYPLTYQLQTIEDFLDGISQGIMKYDYTLDGKLQFMTYPDGKKIHYAYDVQKGVLEQFTDAFGQITKYFYNVYGRLVKMQIVGSSHEVHITYYTKEENLANSGKIKSITCNNGVEKHYSYDGFGAIENLTITNINIKSPNNILLKTEYTYEETTRNIIILKSSSTVSPHDSHLNYTAKYSYNSLNQLVVAKKLDPSNDLISTTNYEYDAANNLTFEELIDKNSQSICTTYVYDTDNKLLEIKQPLNNRKLTYDLNGNLIDDGAGSSFIYNEKNQLISYENKSKNIQAIYTYYPNDLRATKEVLGSGRVQFYYDNNDNPNIINEVQADKHTSYLMAGGNRYIRFVHHEKQMIPEYFIDNLKDTIGILDSTNQFKNTYQYDPYGQQDEQLSAIEIKIDENPFKYANEYADIESGLIYLRARYYNPEIKRFMSRDLAMLLNRYNYADSNPIMHIDPSGAFAFLPLLLAVGVGAMIGAGAGGITYAATTQDSPSSGKYWGKLALYAAAGGVAGAAGGLAGYGAGAAIGAGVAAASSVSASLTSTVATSVGTGVVVGAVSGTTDGVVSGILIQLAGNLIEGENAAKGLGEAAWLGALIGGVSGGIAGGITGKLHQPTALRLQGTSQNLKIIDFRPRPSTTYILPSYFGVEDESQIYDIGALLGNLTTANKDKKYAKMRLMLQKMWNEVEEEDTLRIYRHGIKGDPLKTEFNTFTNYTPSTSYIDLAICNPSLTKAQELATQFHKVIRVSTGYWRVQATQVTGGNHSFLLGQAGSGAGGGRLVTFYRNKWKSAWIRLFGY